MRLILFFKLFVFFLFISLVLFAILPDVSILMLFKMIAGGIVLAGVVSILYPEMRGIKSGDVVSVITSNTSVPFLIGRFGRALEEGKKNKLIKVKLGDGSEVIGIVESYEGIISPPRIRVIYEEKLVE